MPGLKKGEKIVLVDFRPHRDTPRFNNWKGGYLVVDKIYNTTNYYIGQWLKENDVDFFIRNNGKVEIRGAKANDWSDYPVI